MNAATPPGSPTPAALRDADIVDALVQGDRQKAFEMLVARYEDKLFRLCLALLRNREAAQDVAQESLVRIWRALPSFDARAALSTWIYAITRNRCLTALARGEVLHSLSDIEVQEEAQALAAPEPPGDGPAALRQLVAQLPVNARQVITLYYFEERSVAEVALMLGQAQGTVKTHLFRARAALLGLLQAQGLGEAASWLQ